jgi:DNA (cytosine-5)-methyltransferase 1
MKSKSLTYIDLFAGCGGLSLGLHNAGWKGLFAIEKSPDAFKTLKFNLIDKLSHFDWPKWLPMTNLEINQVLIEYEEQLKSLNGTVTLVAGGPPCQGFSTAGRRREDDKRNCLINSYIKFIKLVNPKIIFFENVKGFTLEFKNNKSKGRNYSDYVVKSLSELSYKVKGELIDFSQFGIPQKRTRFILVGINQEYIRSENQVDQFFELLFTNKERFLLSKGLSMNSTLKDAISDLLFKHGTIKCPDSDNFNSGLYAKSMTAYQKLMRQGIEIKFPDSHRFVNHHLSIIDKFATILDTAQKNKPINKEIKIKFKINKHTIIPLDGNDKSPTLTTLPDDYLHYKEPRILTVREYARIQSFPDWFEFKGKYTTGGKLRTQEVPRYSQIGNAIPPLFGEQSGLVLKQLISL